MDKRTAKYQIYLSDAEMKAIDDWRFENRMPSRAAAIRALIGRGMFLDLESEDDNALLENGLFEERKDVKSRT